MTTAIVLVFFLVYLGMILGGLPFLQLDRTGVALLGAIALIGIEALRPEQAARSVHLPTIVLLFSFMVVSAQLRLGGYPWVTLKVATLEISPPLVGSSANIIVVDAAGRAGVPIDWKRHARVGVPVPLATLAIVALYLVART